MDELEATSESIFEDKYNYEIYIKVYDPSGNYVTTFKPPIIETPVEPTPIPEPAPIIETPVEVTPVPEAIIPEDPAATPEPAPTVETPVTPTPTPDEDAKTVCPYCGELVSKHIRIGLVCKLKED